MKKLLSLSAIVVLSGFVSTVHADIYAAGPAYGGDPTGGFATCRVINVGSQPVNITSRQVVTNTNTILALSTDTCGVSIPSNRNCAYTAPVAGNFALTCRLIVTGSDPQISGTLDVQNPVGAVRVVVPMQNTNN